MIKYTSSDELAVVQLDAPPVNAISFAMLEELRGAMARAAGDASVQAIVILGGADHFCAGADLAIFSEIRSGDDAVRTSRVFQEAFQEIEDSPKPVVAAVAGHVLGGALELAMACHIRVAALGSRFSMPEVNLGINPGAGGTQRLPRLVGLDAALEMLLGGRPINLPQAGVLGLIDSVCAPDALVKHAAGLLRSGQQVQRTGQLTSKVADAAANRAALEKAEKLVEGVRPELIAPRKILEAVRVGVEESFAAGLAAEQTVFRDCMACWSTQNKIYVLSSTRQTAQLPGGEETAAKRIASAGVLGMGTMGTGIAQALVSAGIRVTACDSNPSALEAAQGRIRSSIERRVRQGKMSPQKAERAVGLLGISADAGALAESELVIEAVFEDEAVKREAIGRLESICRPDCLIATNTSTINLDVLADEMRHPDRLLGLHFFHPAQQMPLVEVIHRKSTPAQVLAAGVQVVKSLGKTPVLVRNREGFVVNRVFLPYLKEAFRLLEEGAEPSDIDAAMVEFGLPMGPLVLIDMSGLDILVLTDVILRRAFPHHGELSPIVDRLVAAGHLGQKSGAGVYRYERGDHTPHAHVAAGAIIDAVRREQGGTQRPMPRDAIVRRLMLRMVAEAFGVLEEQIVQRAADLDVAMVLGIGLADFRGGVIRYACDLGLRRVVSELDELSVQCGPRYAACRFLRESADRPESLFS